MKKRIAIFVLVAIALVTLSVYAERYCPFCGAIGYRETTQYVTESYKTPCAHHAYGTDTHSTTYYVVKGTCTIGGLVLEKWYQSSSSTTCNGWDEGNCLP